MPKQLTKNIGMNHAEKITGAVVESIFNAETSRDHDPQYPFPTVANTLSEDSGHESNI